MQQLDSISIIEKFDKEKMREVIKAFPQQCAGAYKIGKRFVVPESFRAIKNIIFSGMGGSAIGADVIASYLRAEIKIPIVVNRDYSLPAHAQEESLVIINSYSGNTEEALSVFKEALLRKSQVLVVSSGGELTQLAKNEGVAFLVVPEGFPSRCALAFFTFPFLGIFSSMGLIAQKDKEVQEAMTLLEHLEKDVFGVHVNSESNPAKLLAHRLLNHFPIIYGNSDFLSAVVMRWRGQLAENSKTLSSSHLIPEMNHNEISGWSHPRAFLSQCVVVFLRDRKEHPQVNKRMEITKDIVQEKGATVREVWAQGEGLLSRVFTLIFKGDFVSFYLAILKEEDPTEIGNILYVKDRLRNSK